MKFYLRQARNRLVARHDDSQQDDLTTENKDIFRIVIKSKRIKSYHFVLAVSKLQNVKL